MCGASENQKEQFENAPAGSIAADTGLQAKSFFYLWGIPVCAVLLWVVLVFGAGWIIVTLLQEIL